MFPILALQVTHRSSTFISDPYHVMRILNQLSEAILSVINGTDYLQHNLLPCVLRDANRLERDPHLTGLAYDWCSAIFENRQSLRGWEDLLLFSLEVGFRRFDV